MRKVRPTWRTLFIVYAIAVALNYPWELAQSPLFAPASHAGNIWLHCFVASLGDGLMVLLLFGFGWLVLRSGDWFVRPGLRAYAILLASGTALALTVEWIGLHLIHSWTYTEAMPRLPGLDVGIVPVLQMILLPPVIFFVTAALVSTASFRATAPFRTDSKS